MSPSFEDLAGLAAPYTAALISADVSSDLETPISAFMKLRGAGPCFLLESAENGGVWGRYSFLGFDPASSLEFEGGSLSIDDGCGARVVSGDPIKAVLEMVESERVYAPGVNMPFAGGAVGYIGYDLLPFLEKTRVSGGATGVPAMSFVFPGRLVVFDHLRLRMSLCAFARLDSGIDYTRRSFASAVEGIELMAGLLESNLPDGTSLGIPAVCPDEFAGATSNVSKGRFIEMVERAREYIFAGDAYQVVASQRFSVPIKADPFSVYRVLRAENPSPYMFYMELPGVTLVGSSPEPMVTNRGGRAVIRPIAGTRPRGSNEAEDAALERELASDPKERAEHVMLVDLARNDLGRVCEGGTVEVTRLMEIERYSHVMHMVSQVEGTLRAGTGNYELLRASFPAGTVIGAPKVRAGEIVDELEPDMRGPYAGAVGYLSFSGDMDTCIAIRTAIVKDGIAHVQAGAGIVADSDPESEYHETRHKARALMRALRLAEEVSV